MVKTDGSGFTNLHNFTTGPGPGATNSDGANPFSGMILSGSTLYGAAQIGGSSGAGTIFSLSLGVLSPPQLGLTRSGANVILTWPTNAAGFTLQSTTNLLSPTSWTTVSPGPTIICAQNVVTNAITIGGDGKFYRLSQ